MSKPIAEMTKDELAEYALAELGLDLDMRKSLDTLRDMVAKAAKKGAPETNTGDETVIAADAPIPLASATHFKNAETGNVFPATKYLADSFVRYGHPVPCNAGGQSIAVVLPKQ